MKKLVAVFFTLVSVAVIAQNASPAKQNSLDNQYTPDNETGIYNLSTFSKKSAKDVTVKNIITYDIGMMFRGVASINYERVLFKYLSVQVGIGVTYTKDQLQNIFVPIGLGISGQNNNSANEIDFSSFIKQSQYQSAGIFLEGGLKAYLKGSAPKGIFLQANVTYAQYNLYLNSTSYDYYYVTGPRNENVNNFNFNLSWGYQFVSHAGKVRFANMVYAGVGLRNITYNNLKYFPSTYDPNTGNYTQAYSEFDGIKNVLIPAISFGYCLGLGF